MGKFKWKNFDYDYSQIKWIDFNDLTEIERSNKNLLNDKNFKLIQLLVHS